MQDQQYFRLAGHHECVQNIKSYFTAVGIALCVAKKSRCRVYMAIFIMEFLLEFLMFNTEIFDARESRRYYNVLQGVQQVQI